MTAGLKLFFELESDPLGQLPYKGFRHAEGRRRSGWERRFIPFENSELAAGPEHAFGFGQYRGFLGGLKEDIGYDDEVHGALGQTRTGRPLKVGPHGLDIQEVLKTGFGAEEINGRLLYVYGVDLAAFADAPGGGDGEVTASGAEVRNHHARPDIQTSDYALGVQESASSG